MLLLLACRYMATTPPIPRDTCDASCFPIQVFANGKPARNQAFHISVDPTTKVRLDLDVSSDRVGTVEVCAPPGSLPVGHPRLHVQSPNGKHDLAMVDLDIRPFGYEFGRERTVGAPDTLSPPSLSLPDAPFLQPETDTWYAYQVTTPSLVNDLLAFAGTNSKEDVEHNPYHIGLATYRDGVVSNISAAPVLPVSAWDSDSQHDPDLHWDGSQYVLYFQGRSTPDGLSAIGRATSPDGKKWTVDPENPVFANTDLGGAAHPSVVYADDGWVEMWHAGEGGIGFALETDLGFVPFCGDPVLDVRGEGLKTPQVRQVDGEYQMTVAVGSDPSWHIGWAESYDGQTWNFQEDLLDPGTADWNDQGLSNASFVDDGFVVGGVGPTTSGLAFLTTR